MKTTGLSLKEIDDLLEHLYRRFKGKGEGLSLAEPAVILLARLKSEDKPLYSLQLPRFSPIIIDVLLSGAFRSFGFDGLESISQLAGDIPPLANGINTEQIENGRKLVESMLAGISGVLNGGVQGSPQPGGGAAAKKPDFFRESITGSVGLPLVSTFGTGASVFSAGRVVNLQVRLLVTGEWSVRKKHDPVISFEHISAEPDSPFERQIFMAVREAEKSASSVLKIPALSRIPREYRISLPEIASLPSTAIGMMTGGSVGLAMTALLISLLSRLDLSLKGRSIPAGTAITGMIGEDGGVLPVSEPHIEEKIRSVFFSTYSRLILPSRNMESAEREVAKLKMLHPARRIELVPVLRTSDIFRDAGITEPRSVSPARTILQRLFHWRKHLATGMSVLAALFVLLYILPPYADKTVAKVDLVDSLIVMYNKSDHIVADHNIHFAMGRRPNPTTLRFFLSDYTGDSGNKIIGLFNHTKFSKSKRPVPDGIYMFFFDDQGRITHESVYNDENVLGKEISNSDNNLILQMAWFTCPYVDSDGNAALYLVTNNSSKSPFSILRISLADFSRQVYLHYGSFHDQKMMDFDGDGRLDLVFLGYNEPLGSAVMIVFDPAHINGASPDGYRYDVPGFNDDIARYYIRFPDSGHCVRKKHCPSNPLSLQFPNDSEEFFILIRGVGSDLQFFFDGAMRCSEARIVEYSGTLRGKTDTIVDLAFEGVEKDKEDLKNGVRYWNGSEWVGEPAINRSYLKALETTSKPHGVPNR